MFFFLLFFPNLEKLDAVAERLTVMQYNQVSVMIADVDENEGGNSLDRLTSILVHRGQEREKDSLRITEVRRKTATDNISYIDDLALAYYELYYARNKELSMKLFEETYQKLSGTNYSGLKKLTLFGCLQLYSRENTLSKRQFDYYLEQLYKLDLTINQKALALFYTNFFDGMSASQPERYDKSIRELYTFLLNHQAEIYKEIKRKMYLNIALDFRTVGQLDSTETYLKKLIASNPSKYERKLLFSSYLELGRIYTVRNDLEAAREYFDLAKDNFDLWETLDSEVLFNRYKAFNYYEIIKQYDSAYFALKKSRLDEAKLDYQKNNLLISELIAKLQTKDKERKLLEQQQKTRTNRNWLIAASLALLLGTGIAILLQKNTAKKRQLAEQEVLLKQQRVDNLLKEQELVSIDAMIAGQEKERQRVANELHDDLGSLMATIQLHFENAKVSKKDPALKSAQKLLEQAYQKVRGMAHHKNSGVMSDQGLLPAIQKMARTISETNVLEVTVEDFGLGERMENSLELTIFRMIQELVANAIKHAEATEVNIQLTQHEENLNIIVADNGKGFDRTQLDATHSGMGLTNVEKRVEHLEGSFTIDSVLEKGTSILIDIPV